PWFHLPFTIVRNSLAATSADSSTNLTSSGLNIRRRELRANRTKTYGKRKILYEKSIYRQVCPLNANSTHTFANVLNTACIALMPRQRHGRRHAVVTYDTGVKPPKPGVSRY
ncbi:TPA: hypothetical protein ACIX3M_005035, partial [Escherichia coli]